MATEPAGIHPAVTIELAERDLRQELDERPDIDVLVLLHYAVVADRGECFASLAGAPGEQAVDRMDTDTRGHLADALRRAANAVDPGTRPWELVKVDRDTFYVERGFYRFGPYELVGAEQMARTLNMLEASGE